MLHVAIMLARYKGEGHLKIARALPPHSSDAINHVVISIVNSIGRGLPMLAGGTKSASSLLSLKKKEKSNFSLISLFLESLRMVTHPKSRSICHPCC